MDSPPASGSTLIAESGPSQTGPTEPVPVYEKDEDYYIDSTLMIFQVENCLFRVPAHIFADAPVFAGMIRLPQSGESCEGLSDDDPIVLPSDVRSDDFENLLEALHPLQISLKLDLTNPKWISVLKLSTLWFLTKFRALAISEIERINELTSIQKVQMGRAYKISKWVVEGFTEFVMREARISAEEALSRIREKRIARALTRVVVMKEFEEEFCGELQDIRTHEEAFKEAQDDIPLPPEEYDGPPPDAFNPWKAAFAFPSKTSSGTREWELPQSVTGSRGQVVAQADEFTTFEAVEEPASESTSILDSWLATVPTGGNLKKKKKNK
ncbi:hypothetical protein D9613_001031 [Agrocybe pediades]|uniref:BTB domain-containing protein n=1 Tax=Agrocybe pediades TaxID=84607 RepID=A0A8H4R0W1_9AGAR|nr:hypothetical protein D9613_001031 [Agrocybe pediades]